MSRKIAIAWLDLNYYGRFWFAEDRHILTGISGAIEFGSLTGLMGPSGAGKTTLLKCINGLNMDGVDRDSEIYLSADRRIRSCFIVQDITGHLMPGLTVMQSLIYASKLKNSSLVMPMSHERNALRLLSELCISGIDNTAVEKLSGGERKRLAIAQELTAILKPNVLCIDEPTSGLDSSAAEVVIKCLKALSRTHSMSIVASIHQPNSELLGQFDQLYVLAKTGTCIYAGPPAQIRTHLQHLDFPCQEYQVPIEVLLKIASKYEDSLKCLSAVNTQESRQELKARCLAECSSAAPLGTRHKTRGFNPCQVWHLLGRTVADSVRSQWKLHSMFYTSLLGFALMLTQLVDRHMTEPTGCFTPNQTIRRPLTVDWVDEQFLLAQNQAFIFITVFFAVNIYAFFASTVFQRELRVFQNEHRNGWYSSGSYYWAKTLADLPLTLIVSLAYITLCYRLSHQISDDESYYRWIAIFTAATLCSQGMGITMSALAGPNERQATILTTGASLLCMMFSGFAIPIPEMPLFLQYVSNAAFARHVFEMIMIATYGLGRCPTGQISSVLYQMQVTDDERIFWSDAYILGFHALNFRLLALVLLLIRANGQRLGAGLLRRSSVRGPSAPTAASTVSTRNQINYVIMD